MEAIRMVIRRTAMPLPERVGRHGDPVEAFPSIRPLASTAAIEQVLEARSNPAKSGRDSFVV